MAADKNDRPCYDCASNYIYQFEPCTIESIERGVWARDDGFDCLPICTKHHVEWQANEIHKLETLVINLREENERLRQNDPEYLLQREGL